MLVNDSLYDFHAHMQQFIARINGQITINGIFVCPNCIY